MKVIAYSAWRKPEVFDARDSREAKRIARRIREEQRKPEIHTERSYKEL
jgi:hypothetical protein